MDDAEALFQLRSDPDQMHYLDREPMQTAGEAAEMIVRIQDDGLKGTGYNWALEEKPDSGMIGYAGIWRIDHRNSRGEIGYLLGKTYQGKGLMTEALMSALLFAFTRAGLHSIEANVNPGNARSIRLLERCGFVREAYFRENYNFRGKFLDTAVYSLLSADFKYQDLSVS
jgi:ribosomal-protein-alanine N-acetyltransferase